MRKPKHSRRAFQNIMGNILEWLSLHYKKIAASFFLVAVAVFAFFLGMQVGIKRGKSTETFSNKKVVHRSDALKPDVTEKPVQTARPEKDIYTFLQGPKSWGKRLKWSGEWGENFYDGGSFGGFGCGLCLSLIHI